jgi:hypothetical protein
MITKQQGYRHGENLLLKISKLPTGLKKETTKVFMKGSHGHDHSIDKGDLYFTKDAKDIYVYGYLKAKGTKLFHEEHSPKGIAIIDGIYQLRKQQEFTPEGLVPVID